MNYESAEKQFSLAYPAAVLINHCHPKRTNLCCCTVSMIDEHALGCSKGDTVQQGCTISLKVWEKKSLIFSTSIRRCYWYRCTHTLMYEHNSSQRIIVSVVVVVCSLHLEIMCSSCHLWRYRLNSFQSSSVCVATLLVLHCNWLQWKLNFSIPHSCFFTHEWGAAAFKKKKKTCQKRPLQLRSCTNDAVHGVL